MAELGTLPNGAPALEPFVGLEPTVGRALAQTLYKRHRLVPGELGAQTSVAEHEPISPQALAQWLNGSRFRGDDITRRCDSLKLKVSYTPGLGWTAEEVTHG